MQISQSNFLEITINPQQLWIMIEGLYSRLTAQEQRVAQVSTQAGFLETFVLQRTKQQYKVLTEELENVKIQSKQAIHFMRSNLIENEDRSARKIGDLQNTINTLNFRLQNVKAQLQDDLALKLCYLEKKISSFEGSQQRETLQFVKKVESINEKLNELAQKNQQINKTKIEFQDKTNKQLALYDEQILKLKQNLDRDSLTYKDKLVRSRSKQKIKTQKNINNQDLLIQSKLEYKNEEVSKTQYTAIKSKNNLCSDDRRPKQMLRLLAQKIEGINQSINQNFPQMRDKLNRYIVRSEIVCEQVDFINKKLEKERAQFNVLSQQIKLYQDKRNNQKEMQNIKNCICQVNKDLNDCIEAKLNKEVFEKYQKFVNDKLSFLIENYFQKADKNEVKKGLSFLEDKLKQIILVTAEQKNLNKDGALKKVLPKCLSCDKQLDLINDNTKKQLRSSFNLQGRVSTPHLRKKYKNVYQTTLQDQN